MEKICIVERRKKNIQEVEKGYIIDKKMIACQKLGVISSHAVKDNMSIHGGKKSFVKELNGDKNKVISFNLTPEQCNLIRSGNFAQYLSNGISSGTPLNVQQHEDGQISLSFHFERVNTLRLLKSKHVCEMLQISKSFLMKLTKTKRLKSYKIGRLRRFSLEDVLEYLTRNEEPGNPEYKG